MDHYFIGLGLYHRNGAEFLHRAREHFDRALELDPDNVDALVRRAWVEVTFVVAWLREDRVERLNLAEADLRKALRLRPASAEAHAALGVLFMNSGRAELGIVECERGLALDRNLATAHAWIGMGKYYSGQPDETEGRILQALRISPRDAFASAWMVFAAFAKFGEGKDEEGDPLDRREPRLHDRPFRSRRRARRSRAHGGSARSGPRRARPQPGHHHRPLPRLPVQRPSPLPRRPRPHPRRLRRAGVPEG
jgi:tetratricopeptide (TPR) repeat protein